MHCKLTLMALLVIKHQYIAFIHISYQNRSNDTYHDQKGVIYYC